MSTTSTLDDAALGPSQTARMHTVTVGKGAHRFDPETVFASVGDLVTFEFYPLNHSVVRAQYGYPCIPYETMLGGQAGLFSGLFPVPSISKNPPTWNLTINDTNPIFYYCSAPGSCLDWGMVGTINPNSTTSLQKQRALALDAQIMLQPGEGFPSEATASVSSETPAESTEGVLIPDLEPTHTAEPSPSKNGFAPPVIAAIVLGAVVASGFILAALLLFFRSRYWNLRRGKTAEAPIPTSPTNTKSMNSTTIPERFPDTSLDQSTGQDTISSPCMSPQSLGSLYGDPLSPRTIYDMGLKILEKDSRVLYELPES